MPKFYRQRRLGMSLSEITSSTPRLLTICISANMAGLLAGMHLALFSGILEMKAFATAVTTANSISSIAKSVITVALIFSFTIASPYAGPVMDRIGRRQTFLLAASLFTLSPILTLVARSTTHVVMARLLAGFAYSLVNIACPAYTAEIAPTNMRGALVNLYQLMITIGILLAQLLNVRFASGEWRGPVASSIIPAVSFLIAVALLVPESPVWAASRINFPDTQPATSTSNTERTEDLKNDVETGQSQSSAAASIPAKPTFGALLFDGSARRRLIIGMGISAAQQWSGINAVIFFGPALVSDVLKWDGILASLKAAVLIGTANVVATLFSIMVVQRFGRRTLLLAGGPMMAVSLVMLGAKKGNMLPISDYAGIAALLTFIVSFAVTYGPLPFLVCSEIFPVRYKGIGMSVCGVVLGVSSLVVGATFLPMMEALGGMVYFLYAACMVLATVFVWKLVPETRGLTLEEIDALIERKDDE